MANNNVSFNFASIMNGMPVTFVVTAKKGLSRKGVFQLEGSIFTPNGKEVTKWYWGLDQKTGRLYHDPKTGLARAYIVRKWSPDADNGFELAAAVQAAYQQKELRHEEIVPESASIQIDELEQVAGEMDSELAIVDSMGESPLDRLAVGDPSIFLELGATQGHALQWSKWIRENSPEIHDVTDLSQVSGIGKASLVKLVTAWQVKYAA